MAKNNIIRPLEYYYLFMFKLNIQKEIYIYIILVNFTLNKILSKSFRKKF